MLLEPLAEVVGIDGGRSRSGRKCAKHHRIGGRQLKALRRDIVAAGFNMNRFFIGRELVRRRIGNGSRARFDFRQFRHAVCGGFRGDRHVPARLGNAGCRIERAALQPVFDRIDADAECWRFRFKMGLNLRLLDGFRLENHRRDFNCGRDIPCRLSRLRLFGPGPVLLGRRRIAERRMFDARFKRIRGLRRRLLDDLSLDLRRLSHFRLCPRLVDAGEISFRSVMAEGRLGPPGGLLRCGRHDRLKIFLRRSLDLIYLFGSVASLGSRLLLVRVDSLSLRRRRGRLRHMRIGPVVTCHGRCGLDRLHLGRLGFFLISGL